EAVKPGAQVVFVRRLKSPSIQRGEPEQETCIAVELIAAEAPADLRGAAAEVEAALRPEERAAHEFRLVLVEVLPVEIEAESDVVASLCPVEIRHVLILGVAPVVRHVIVVGPDVGITVDREGRPAALEPARAVRTRDLQQIEAEILAEASLLGAGVHASI